MDLQYLPEGYYRTEKGEVLRVIRQLSQKTQLDNIYVRKVGDKDLKSLHSKGTLVGSQKGYRAYNGYNVDELKKIVKDPTASMVTFAKSVARCGKCAKKLSAKSSIENGVGPECAKKR